MYADDEEVCCNDYENTSQTVRVRAVLKKIDNTQGCLVCICDNILRYKRGVEASQDC